MPDFSSLDELERDRMEVLRMQEQRARMYDEQFRSSQVGSAFFIYQ